MRSLLDSHPDVVCMGEIMHQTFSIRVREACFTNEKPFWNKKAAREVVDAGRGFELYDLSRLSWMLNEVLWRYDQKGKWVGFKIMVERLFVHGWDKYFRLLRKQMVVIHTIRNPLSQYVSFMQAIQNGGWITYENTKKPKTEPVRLVLEDALEYMTKELAGDEKIHRLFGDCVYKEVRYADLQKSFGAMQHKLQQWLGLKKGILRSSVVKTGSNHIPSRVSNWAEFEQKLPPEWRWVLEEDLI